MSAREDAQTGSAAPGRSRPGRDFTLLLPLYGAPAGALLVVALLSIPALAPDLPRYVCGLPAADGRRTVEVRASDPAALRALGRSTGVEAEARAARARVSDQLAASPVPDPPPAALAPGAECAACLASRAALAAALAGEGGELEGVPAGLPPLVDALERAESETEHAAMSADPTGLRAALRAEDLAAAAWLARSFGDARERLARWRVRERDRGAEFALAADVIASELTEDERAPIAGWKPQIARDLEAGALAALDASAAGAGPVAVRPIASVWSLGALIGAVLGALAGFLARVRLGRVRDRDVHAPVVTTDRRPAAAQLSVLCAVQRLPALQGSCELAARDLDRSRRVLIVDGARDLLLDRGFGVEARWGAGECATNALPLLGAVQSLGVPGLFFLARGDVRVRLSGALLGRLLEDARRHFDGVILVVNRAALAASDLDFAGRDAAGWWVDAGKRWFGRTAAAPIARGTPFTRLELTAADENPLEALRARVHAAPPAPPIAAVAPAPVVAAESAAFARLARTPLADEGDARTPLAVESDAQTRERLRFLIWMRRVQSERGPGTLSAAGN